MGLRRIQPNLDLTVACGYDARCSPVAQLVEQVAVNHPVGSSSLSRGASFFVAVFAHHFTVAAVDSTHPFTVAIDSAAWPSTRWAWAVEQAFGRDFAVRQVSQAEEAAAGRHHPHYAIFRRGRFRGRPT